MPFINIRRMFLHKQLNLTKQVNERHVLILKCLWYLYKYELKVKVKNTAETQVTRGACKLTHLNLIRVYTQIISTVALLTMGYTKRFNGSVVSSCAIKFFIL